MLLLGRRMHYVQRREKILDALRTFVYEIFLEIFYVKIKVQFTFFGNFFIFIIKVVLIIGSY